MERQDVWYVLSDLFLDTQLSRDDLFDIARHLAATSFSVYELQSIMQDEVAPTLEKNLFVMGGQWGMFDREKEVIQPILARLDALSGRAANGWFPFLWFRRKWCMMNVNDDWQKILSLLKASRLDIAS